MPAKKIPVVRTQPPDIHRSCSNLLAIGLASGREVQRIGVQSVQPARMDKVNVFRHEGGAGTVFEDGE
jgi:hypothetical protein